MKDTMIGVDLAKRVFQVHGATMRGEVKFRRKLTREQFRAFMAAQAPTVVVFEACGGARYWAREMAVLGHEVRLIAPQYVRPFVKRQKNDAADAEAIVVAAQRPEMRFVTAKTADQQARAVLFRRRKRLVRQRTELVNALRATLYEYGHTIPQTARARRSIPEGSWLAKMLGKKPRMLVVIALANKMARTIWAMLTKEEDYRDPARAVAA